LYGIIDIGSNNIRLVIYKTDESKILTVINTKINASLAGYINADRKLTRKGIRKAAESINSLNHIADNFNLDQLYVFATAVLHNITNRDEAVQAIEDATGLHVVVLSGAEKAVFGYYGLANEYRDRIDSIDHDAQARLQSGLIIDIGGSSTEIVFYEQDKIRWARSIPIGSLNLFRRYVNDIVPDLKELTAIKKAVRQQVQRLNMLPFPSSDIIICEGGTAGGFLRLLKTLYPNQVTDDIYSADYLNKFIQFYKNDRRKCVRQILMTCPDRIHTLLPGIMILKEVIRLFDCKSVLTISNGVREGYLMHMLKVEEAQHE